MSPAGRTPSPAISTPVPATTGGAVFKRLCADAAACTLCPRLAHKKAVLSPLNGSLTPRVLFIGEAPGRRGADRTRRPFTGDQSGQRFDELLASISLRRDEIFITMAVLCCPCDEKSNLTPNSTEIANCSSYLARTLDLLKPPVVATVGAIALRSLGKLIGRRFSLSEHVGTVISLDNFSLVPLYHVSPRVLRTTRSLDQQRQDFATVRRALTKS
jgi:uracil-DNA glycosylase family 4